MFVDPDVLATIFDQDEKKYLEEVVDSTFVSSVGKTIKIFEDEIKNFTSSIEFNSSKIIYFFCLLHSENHQSFNHYLVNIQLYTSKCQNEIVNQFSQPTSPNTYLYYYY